MRPARVPGWGGDVRPEPSRLDLTSRPPPPRRSVPFRCPDAPPPPSPPPRTAFKAIPRRRAQRAPLKSRCAGATLTASASSGMHPLRKALDARRRRRVQVLAQRHSDGARSANALLNSASASAVRGRLDAPLRSDARMRPLLPPLRPTRSRFPRWRAQHSALKSRCAGAALTISHHPRCIRCARRWMNGTVGASKSSRTLISTVLTLLPLYRTARLLPVLRTHSQ